jgi:hypothetical protein
MSYSAASSFSLADRMEYGNFTVREVCELKNRSKPGFYEDLKAGLVTIRKIGSKSVVPGPVAKAYIEGRTLS